jgi:hypothetical protein
MKKPPIIIHVPKTGGTTLFMAISGSNRPPKANHLYRHVIMNEDQTDMNSNCGDIFEVDSKTTYANQYIILMIRNPLDRLESEFGFLGNRKEFRSLWKHNTNSEYPLSFNEFVSHPATSNSICRFLLGYSLYGDQQVSETDFERIISTLDELNFVFGLTSDMGTTIRNVEHRCGVRFGQELPRYRTSIYKPKRGDDWSSVESTFAEMNTLDLALEAEITARFQIQVSELPKGRTVSFTGNEYDSIYMFLNGTELRSPLEIYANDLSNPAKVYDWVKERKTELDKEVNALMTQCNGDGKSFLNAWLDRSIAKFLDDDSALQINRDDPLQTLRTLTELMFQE